MFTRITNNVKSAYRLLYALLYQTTTIPNDKEWPIWDYFDSIDKMLDELFTISEEHGLLGPKPSCSCTEEDHFKMESQIKDTLDNLICLLE